MQTGPAGLNWRSRLRHGNIVAMTRLLEEAIHKLRQLPETMQDSAARAVISQLEEEPEPGDAEAITAGRADFERGDYVRLDQLRHEMGTSDR
jgi:hypothetical protein